MHSHGHIFWISYVKLYVLVWLVRAAETMCLGTCPHMSWSPLGCTCSRGVCAAFCWCFCSGGCLGASRHACAVAAGVCVCPARAPAAGVRNKIMRVCAAEVADALINLLTLCCHAADDMTVHT